jgi:hypothetical protein
MVTSLILAAAFLVGQSATAAADLPRSWQAVEEASGTLVDVAVELESDTVGSLTTLIVSFGILGDQLPPQAQIQIAFPPEFDKSTIDSMIYSDTDELNIDYQVVEWLAANDIVSLELDTLGTPATEGSQMSVAIYGLGNAETSTSYRLALAILDSNDAWLAVPVWTPQFSLQPGPLSSFSIDPNGVVSVNAGEVINFEVNAEDGYGNILTLDLESVDWILLQSPGGNHEVSAGRFEARLAGSYKLKASYGEFSGQCIIYVLAGEFAQLRLAGGALSAHAGIAWLDDANDVTVSAHDIFGNLITDFEGEVYFSSSDPGATLPATAGGPYQFSLEDQGKHDFTGSSFEFTSAGLQIIDLWYQGEIQATLEGITVLAGLLADFSVEIPTTATAGVPFIVTVADAVDSFGNPVSGLAVVELPQGDGQSPSGALPNLDDFVVSAGQGSGDLVLVAAEPTTVRLTLDSLNESEVLTVSASGLDRLQFDLDLRQVPKQPFRTPAQLTAFDRFGNLVDNFSAVADPITITTSGSGVLANNIINAGAAFENGVCDLSQIGTQYDGDELLVSFTATSASGVVGLSPLVEFSRVLISSGRVSDDSLFVGEDFFFELTLTNFGTQELQVAGVELFANDKLVDDIILTPALPDLISGGSSQIYTIAGNTAAMPLGEIIWSAAFSGMLGSDAVRDSVGGLAQTTLLGQEGISLVPGTLEPTQVSVERSYEFSVEIANQSVSDLNLSTETKLQLSGDGISGPSLLLESATLVPAGESVRLRFATGSIAGQNSALFDQVELTAVGTLGGVEYYATLGATSELTAQSLPDLQYLTGSLEPAILYRNGTTDFALGVSNQGSATLEKVAGELRLYAGGRLITTILSGQTTISIPSGERQLNFNSVFVPGDFPVDLDSLVISLSGEANGHSESSRLLLPVIDLAIPSGPAVALKSLVNGAPNAPWVNLGQRFELAATIANLGDEELRDVRLALTSDGVSSFAGELVLPFLALAAETTVTITIDAALETTSSEIFTATLLSAEGVTSGLAAEVNAPASINQFVVIQRPANLSLSAAIASPQEAQDGLIQPGVEFVITAVVENSGQAEVGSGELNLIVSNQDFVAADELTQQFEINEPVSWTISSPLVTDSSDFRIEISQVPLDANLQLPARLTQSAAELSMIARDVEVGLSVDFQTLETPLVSAGGSYDILTLDFDVLGDEQPYLNYLDVYLRNRNGVAIPADQIIGDSELLLNNESPSSGVVQTQSGALRFPLGPEFGTPTEAVVNLTLVQNPSVSDFVLHLDSTSFSAAYQSASGEKPVRVNAAFATKLVIEQSYTLVSEQLEQAFFCYPNPFSPERQTLKFTNPLPQQSKTLTIFTLAGEEVLRREIAAAEADVIIWDGRNNAGHQVLNGVYLAILTVPGEGEVRTKIAVVK